MLTIVRRVVVFVSFLTVAASADEEATSSSGSSSSVLAAPSDDASRTPTSPSSRLRSPPPTTDSSYSSSYDDVVDATTLRGKIVAGYQGWFSTPEDGGRDEWHHWLHNAPGPRRGRARVAAWPDLREFDADDELRAVPSNATYADGAAVGLYSSHDPRTVDRHARWMRDHGVDGVFAQRFLSELRAGLRDVRDAALRNVRAGAERYGRIYANMYDVSLTNGATLVEDVKTDWIHLVDEVGITNSSRHLRHKGRPVVAIWGFGMENRPGNPAQLLELVRWFHTAPNERHRAVVVGGVNQNWRRRHPPPSPTKNDNDDITWYDALRELDVVSPWTVGRIDSMERVVSYRREYWEPDLRECEAHDMDYLPVVYPGFSYHNAADDKPFNEIPRLGGRFYWHQLHHAVASGASMVYVAMFDEVDEGTAIYKLAETVDATPVGEERFVTLNEDADEHDEEGRRRVVPCDWYLTLTGTATRYFRSGDGSIPETMPELPSHGCGYNDIVESSFLTFINVILCSILL